MNARQRMLAAIQGDPTVPPVVIPYLQYYFPEVVEQLTAFTVRDLFAHEELAVKVEAWSELHNYFDCDWVRATLDYSRVIDLEEADELDTADFAAVEGHPVEELVDKGCYELAREMVGRFGGDRFIYGRVQVPYAALFGNWSAIGDSMLMLALEPDRAKRLIDDSLPRRIEEIEAWKDTGVDGLWLGQWMCSADMISEDMYLKFIYEADRAIIKAVQDAGLVPIYHFCGDVHPRLKHIRDHQTTIFGCEEPKKGFDIQVGRVREELGPDTTLLGNVDAYGVVECGTPDEWKAEVHRQIDAAGPRRFIVSVGSPITHDTPPERLKAFVSAAKEVCETYG